MSFMDYMGAPEFDENGDVVMSISEKAFICTRCGSVKEDQTSTYAFCGDEVLCEKCGGFIPD